MVKYYWVSWLFMEFIQVKVDGIYSKKFKSLVKFNLFILDDWGLELLKVVQCNDLMEIMDDCYGSSFIIFISQLFID